MWKPIDQAPKDGTMILVKGGTYHDTSETFPDEYPLKGVSLVHWHAGHQSWRGEQTTYDEYCVHTPTHFISTAELLKLE